MEAKYWSTAELSRFTNISLRQAQWWDQQGHLCPMQPHHVRRYSTEQIRYAYVLAAVRAVLSLKKSIELVKVWAAAGRKRNGWLIRTEGESETGSIFIEDGPTPLQTGKYTIIRVDLRPLDKKLSKNQQPALLELRRDG